MTRHREQILNMINASCSHMTAKQIFEQIKKSDRSIARATVYNSLKYLTQTGQIRRVKVQGECDRYDRISHDLVSSNQTHLAPVDLGFGLRVQPAHCPYLCLLL